MECSRVLYATGAASFVLAGLLEQQVSNTPNKLNRSQSETDDIFILSRASVIAVEALALGIIGCLSCGLGKVLQR